MRYLKLYGLGMASILTLLLVEFTVPSSSLGKFNETELKILVLVNPLLMLIFLGTAGHILAPRVGLSSFIFKSNLETARFSWPSILNCLLVTAPLAMACLAILEPYRLAEVPSVPLLTRVFYGGIFEELTMRWGLMSGGLYLLQKAKISLLKKWPFVLVIFCCAILFGLGHLAAGETFYQMTAMNRILIVAANTFAGVAAGWLFWKFSLEQAIAYHVSLGALLWCFSSII